MKKYLLILATAIVAIGFMGQSAHAAKKAKVVVTPPPPVYWPWYGYWGVADPQLAVSNTIVGAASTGAYFALRDNHRHHGWRGNHNGISSGGAYVVTSIGCAAASPIIGTLWLKRPLTQREVSVSTANCFLPFVGGYLVNAAFDAHPEWEAGKR